MAMPTFPVPITATVSAPAADAERAAARAERALLIHALTAAESAANPDLQQVSDAEIDRVIAEQGERLASLRRTKNNPERRRRVAETVARNGLDNAAIRLIATGGVSSDYMTPHGNPSLVIMVTPVPVYPETQYSEGCKATTVEMPINPPNHR